MPDLSVAVDVARHFSDDYAHQLTAVSLPRGFCGRLTAGIVYDLDVGAAACPVGYDATCRIRDECLRSTLADCIGSARIDRATQRPFRGWTFLYLRAATQTQPGDLPGAQRVPRSLEIGGLYT